MHNLSTDLLNIYQRNMPYTLLLLSKACLLHSLLHKWHKALQHAAAAGAGCGEHKPHWQGGHGAWRAAHMWRGARHCGQH